MSQVRVFKFTPKDSPQQCYKVGFGTVIAGESVVIDPDTEPDRLAYAEADAELKEVKGKQADDAVAALDDPTAGAEPLDEIATTHPDTAHNDGSEPAPGTSSAMLPVEGDEEAK